MSPCYVKMLTTDGLQPVSYSADSLTDAARYEPQDGIYTLTNTYHTFQVLKFDAHLDRMEDSARRENIPLKLSRPALRAALRQMIADSGFGDVRFRITIPHNRPDSAIIALEPFTPISPELIAQGVRCITLLGLSRRNPAAKTTDWMHTRQQAIETIPPGIYTGLLVNENGDILEGVNSNFYAVLNGELRTAGEGVLPGIAQQIIFEVAPAVLPIRRDGVNVKDLPHLSEAFITSSSRGIVPVVEIDGITIGTGQPGPKTLDLRAAYGTWVQAHLEDL